MQTTIGYLSLLLHAHLPFVRHPQYDFFLEEEWLFEAINETYLPLLNILDKLNEDHISFKLTISFSPTLLSMLDDTFLQTRFIRYMENLIALSDREIMRTKAEPAKNKLARYYNEKFRYNYNIYLNKYKKNIISGYANLQKSGLIEIITCNATHGYLPLLNVNENCIKSQVKIGIDIYKKYFNCNPKGLWLAECAYYKGLEDILKENNIKYFYVDTHGILYGTPRAKYGVYAPIYCNNGVAAFGRDIETSRSVWSANEGYPGNANYREFYRDIGYELPMDYLRPYTKSDIRHNTGIKYCRITGKSEEKDIYNPYVAQGIAETHADDFINCRIKQIEHLHGVMDRTPIIISPYDAELLGHWWYEGIIWLDFLIRKLDKSNIKLLSPSDYLKIYPVNQKLELSGSSWGHKGYSEVWLNTKNDWIYRFVHKLGDLMVELADKYYHNTNPEKEEILNQLARELLLLQSSDWAFIITTGTVVEYAVKRIKDHISRFNKLYFILENDIQDKKYVSKIKKIDNIFPEIDFRVYSN